VATEPVAQSHRPLEVHRIAFVQVAEAAAGERLADGVGGPAVGIAFDDGEAAAVHRDRVADAGVLDHALRVDREPRAACERRDRAHATELFDDAGEHQPTS
jgi:hypothetical protein